MAGTIVNNPVVQFFDNNGNPLAGGKITTYLSNTTTPASTWQNEGLSVLNTNPIILNSRGEATIWLTPDIQYTFVLTDANNNLIQTVNDIYGGFQAVNGIPSSFIVGQIPASQVKYTPAGTGAVATTVETKLRQVISIKDKGAVGDGITLDTQAFLDAAIDAVNGDIVLTKGRYLVNINGVFSCGRLIFEDGAVLIPAPGSELIIDAEIVAASSQIFETGKIVTACDCDAGSLNLRTWTYGFEASDVGKPVCLRYGGAVIGPPPAFTNIVQDRVPFSTTISAYVSDLQVTLASGPVSAIRQDYVIAASFANLNTGIAIVGNGTVEFTTKTSSIDVKWFGAKGNNSADDAVSINKAVMSVSRRYDGAKFIFPDGVYIQGQEIRNDVPGNVFYSNPRRATLFRKNGVALERMCNITCVWRGRYGGGGPVKAAENWTFGDPAAKWGGDWAIMSGFTIDGLLVDGNKANQPTLAVGTGLDGWDAGVATLYTTDTLIKNTSSFVNCLRWGVALSTQSHRGTVEDGTYFDSCDEGAFYAETSDDIVVGSIVTKNSPASGWNMGAVTFLRIKGGTIKSPLSTGAHNGIYLRDGCKDIDVDIGKAISCSNNAVWLFDESSGSDRLKNITIRGGSVDGSVNGVVAAFVDGLSISGVKGDVTGKGIFIEQCTKFSVESNSVAGAVEDIEITSGTSLGSVAKNLCDVKLTGTSTVNLTVDVPTGFTFTNATTVPPGLLAVIERNNFGDGRARHKFSTGGVGFPSAAWNFFPIDLNGTVLWVDSAGRLRIKVGYPTGETDGVVVGTQV